MRTLVLILQICTNVSRSVLVTIVSPNTGMGLNQPCPTVPLTL